MAGEACDMFGAASFEWAKGEADRARLWAARHATYYACLAARPGSKGFITDVCVPVSRLADVIAATAEDVEESGVVGPIFGHAGDGNFHCILNMRDDDPPEYTAAVREGRACEGGWVCERERERKRVCVWVGVGVGACVGGCVGNYTARA